MKNVKTEDPLIYDHGSSKKKCGYVVFNSGYVYNMPG